MIYQLVTSSTVVAQILGVTAEQLDYMHDENSREVKVCIGSDFSIKTGI
jgi:hypothetical protein